MILSCQNIFQVIRDRRNFKKCKFSYRRMKKAAIVRINGAGKSTLLKKIMQEETPIP